MSRGPIIKWDDEVIKCMHGAGHGYDDIMAALGLTCLKSSLANHMNRELGLYMREPKVRAPWTEEKRRANAKKFSYASPTYHLVERDGDRLCHRPKYAPPRTTTARLMGDPQPGRTPWA